MTEATQTKSGQLRKAVGLGLFVGVGMQVVRLVLESAFDASFAATMAVSAMVVVLALYPIALRGYPNPLKNDGRPWSLMSFLPFAAGLGVVIYLLGSLLDVFLD